MAYLSRPRRERIEVMPLSNVAASVDWGYLPIGYFGVDERFGKRSDFQQMVDVAHQHGIAVIVDVVYGHTGVDFPYYDAYTRLRYRENPFMGPFAKDYFSNFGKSTDFNRQLTRDYFFTVEPPLARGVSRRRLPLRLRAELLGRTAGVGYASLVYETYQLTKTKLAQSEPYWTRFDAGRARRSRLIQCAEQLEGPEESAADDVLQQHLAEPHVRRCQGGGTRRPRPAYRFGAFARTVRLSRRRKQQRRRHSQNRPAIHGKPRSRALHLQLRAQQSGRSRQSAFPRRRPQPLVHAAAIPHRYL